MRPYIRSTKVLYPELTVQERYVLEQTGQLPRRPWSLMDIAELWGVTHHWIRVVEQQALSKLSARAAT